MSVVGGDVVGGLFALACHMQDVDPMLGNPVGEPHQLSFVSRDGKGAMVGWAKLDGQSSMEARLDDDGAVRLTGASFKGDGATTWAELMPRGDNFEMEWLMYDRRSKDGRRTVAVWSKGRCQRLAIAKDISQ